jgi:hypothetical protein
MKLLQCVAIAILLITPARGASLYTGGWTGCMKSTTGGLRIFAPAGSG